MLEKFLFQPQLPKIPDSLIQSILNNDGEYINAQYFKEGEGRIIRMNGTEVVSGLNKCRNAPDELKDWVTNNITRHWANIGTVETDTDKTKPVIGAHIDRVRNYDLLYPIQTGGPEVYTVFYRVKDPKKRDAFFYTDYSELEEIARVRVPQNTWCVFNTKTIHAVEGLESQRITVQVGLWDYVGLPDL
jgi:hypothetical protein